MSTEKIQEARLWRDNGWTARVIKNEDDDGWAVEMTRDGDPEPALTGPWTMGRDKKNPKPLDAGAFTTLVKTASEVLRRTEQQRHASLNKSLMIDSEGRRLRIALQIIPDEDDPHALLTATDGQDELGRARVEASYRLSQAAAQRWADGGFGDPG